MKKFKLLMPILGITSIAATAIPLAGCSCGNKASISLSTSTLEVEVGKTATLIATVTGTSEKVNWYSSNETIATVKASDDSKTATINGIIAGSAVISATVGGKTANCSVTVKQSTGTNIELEWNNNAYFLKGATTAEQMEMTFKKGQQYTATVHLGDHGELNNFALIMYDGTDSGKYTIKDSEYSITLDGVPLQGLTVKATDTYTSGLYHAYIEFAELLKSKSGELVVKFIYDGTDNQKCIPVLRKVS